MSEKISSWDDLRLFLAVAREGGLSPAARSAGSSPATMARRMLTLERSTGQTLFIRHDRGYTLTAEGQVFLDGMGDIERRINDLTASDSAAAQPTVKLSAGSWTTHFLLTHLPALRGTPEDVRLRFVASEAILDLPHREVAIGLRSSRPQNPALAGRKLNQVQFAAYKRPKAPDLWIKVVADTPSARWLDKHAGPDVICEVTAPRNSLDLALAGTGKALLPTFIGDLYPTLRRDGAPIATLSHDQWIVTHQDDRHLPEVRRVLERLYQIFDKA